MWVEGAGRRMKKHRQVCPRALIMRPNGGMPGLVLLYCSEKETHIYHDSWSPRELWVKSLLITSTGIYCLCYTRPETICVSEKRPGSKTSRKTGKRLTTGTVILSY